MKAFAITTRDTLPTVQDLPTPEAATGEVLIEVRVAADAFTRPRADEAGQRREAARRRRRRGGR